MRRIPRGWSPLAGRGFQNVVSVTVRVTAMSHESESELMLAVLADSEAATGRFVG